MDKLLKSLLERRAEIALGCFDSPPSDWAGFQRRLGQYVELQELIDIVQRAMKGSEDDEE